MSELIGVRSKLKEKIMTNETTTTTTVDAPASSNENAVTTAMKMPKPVKHGIAAVLEKMGKDVVVTSKAGTTITPASEKDMSKIAPELTKGLVDSKGKAHVGAKLWVGSDGYTYVVREIVGLTKPQAQYILSNFGKGNRDRIASREKMYIEKMNAGKWRFVFNSVILTVSEKDAFMPSSLEQHNGGHTLRAFLQSTLETIDVVLLLGVPVDRRDILDDNAARTAKDMATCRSEFKEAFAAGNVIEGIKITPALSSKMTNGLTEAYRCIDDVRKGNPPKMGGGRDKDLVGAGLDRYATVLINSVKSIVIIDSAAKTLGKNAKGETVEKAGGALTKRFSISHLAAALALYAGYEDENGNILWDEERADEMLGYIALLGCDFTVTDPKEPMVCLRNTIDRWNADPSKPYKGSDGMNARFAALKLSILAQADGTEIRNAHWLEKIDLIKAVVDPKNQFGGLDDFKNDLDAQMAAANAPEESDEPMPLIDDEMTEESSDVPEESVDE